MDVQDAVNFDFTTKLDPGNVGLIQHGDAQSFAEAAGLPFSYGPGANGADVFTLPDPICEIPQDHHEFFETVAQHAGRPAAFIGGTMYVFGRSDEYDVDGEYIGPQGDGDQTYCGFPTCESEAATTAPVSISLTEIEKRPMCWACNQVYGTGAQHGTLRAVRDLVRRGFREAAEALVGQPLSAEEIAAIGKIDPSEEYGD